ncbi:MAG: tRNA (N6-threonylcarbamoyladenosine(37)-N6)-methyltransferase TrmO [Bacteroidales bacterium]|nr:tRNA (N6-threonylcarbamoyladenosine(37)-N6)-methyltransferase TrmO [Bacteroidales bacterium]
MELKPVAIYKGPFGSKFGIPRQSALAEGVEGRIVFTPEYRVREALRGIEGFSHLWLLWGFSANKEARGEWQPTVRPPRLGGNTAMGVWATRSPYRPNPIGLSCVKLLRVENMELVVGGADLMDGTPIYDIKPYVAYADCIPDAVSGFAAQAPRKKLEVFLPQNLPLSESQKKVLVQVLALDPRPAYQENPEREYVMPFEGGEVVFRVMGDQLSVTEFRRG